METSNLIALGALIVAMIGLVPQFLQVMHQKKSKSRNVTKGTIPRSSLNDKKSTSEETTDTKDTEVSKEPMPFMVRILMLVVFAVASFLIEIIIFGIVAHYCDVAVDLATMTLL